MTDALHVNDMPSNWDDMEDAHIAFGELDVRERIAIALLNENGLQPTNAALDVIMAVVEATDRLDASWPGDAATPSPPMAWYARHAEGTLRALRRAP